MKKVIIKSLTVILILGTAACTNPEEENTAAQAVEKKRALILNMVNEYKEYGASPITPPPSDEQIMEQDMEELRARLEAVKESQELIAKRKKSPEAVLAREYGEKIEATSDEEEKKKLFDELLEKHAQLKPEELRSAVK